MQQPDEDTREELNLPSVNTGLLKDLISRSKATLDDIQQRNPILLKQLAFKLRSQFNFMKRTISIHSIQEILEDEAWQQFVNNTQSKINNADQTECVAILSCSNVPSKEKPVLDQVDLFLITQEKICKIKFTQQETAILWSESCSDGAQGNEQMKPSPTKSISNDLIDERINSIFKMINGYKFKSTAPVLMFGNFTQQAQSDGLANQGSQSFSKQAEKYKETILVKDGQPLFALFAFLRYYLCLQAGKYKSIVKFNLNHPAYFKKRDEIVGLAQDNTFQSYWHACILSLISV